MTNTQRDDILKQLGEDMAVIKRELVTGEKTFVSKLACEKRHAGFAKKLLAAVLLAFVIAFIGGTISAWTNGHAGKRERKELYRAVQELKETMNK